MAAGFTMRETVETIPSIRELTVHENITELTEDQIHQARIHPVNLSFKLEYTL